MGDRTARPSVSEPDPARIAADPDASLLVRLRGGDEQAFATLFSTYSEPVVRFAYRYVKSIDVARDITQDVFIRLWERRTDVPSYGIRAYLFRAARNRALDLLGHDAVVARWEASIRDTSDEESRVSNAGERQIEATETAARVRAALATLTPRAREIVRLVREEGLKPGEVAILLGITPPTVYVHLSRALKQLAEHLRD